MGVSEYLISYALWSADARNATGLYVFPTDRHVSDFSSARVGPALSASPHLSGIVVGGGERGADRVTLKRVRDRFIYFRGAQVDSSGLAPQLKSIDADVLILDEVDEMDPRAPVIARKRLGHSQIAEERAVSTPTYPGHGIHARYLESDQREWFVPCPHCGERQPLTIERVVQEKDQLERPTRWHGQDEGRAYAACSRCGGELNRLAEGAWVAQYPGRELVGYHLSRLFSPTADLLAIVQELQSTDETKRRECFNQDLGLPYTPKGGQLTAAVLDACRREYAHGPVPGERPVMGLDVGRVLHGVIRGPADAQTGECPQRWAGAIDTWDEATRLLRAYNVAALVVDALPETTKARELQAAFASGTVWLAYYVAQRAGRKQADPVGWDEANGVVNLDRTRTLDATLGRFYAQQATLPAHIRTVADYYDHLRALVRVLAEGPGGEKVARYVESGPDHFGHAENYCYVAAHVPRREARMW